MFQNQATTDDRDELGKGWHALGPAIVQGISSNRPRPPRRMSLAVNSATPRAEESATVQVLLSVSEGVM